MKSRNPPSRLSSFYGRSRRFTARHRLLATAVSACFATNYAIANPSGSAVVAGTAVFNQIGKVLNVTNSNGAVINWQTFNIAAGETTRFIQPTVSSAVMNKVLSADPSLIYGQLTSNGKVWLINPAGILVGASGKIDTAGFVASTLGVSQQDFLAGRINMSATPGAGDVINQGSITTPSGGSVYLIGANVLNNGVITTPQGETILAAGATVHLVDSATPGVRVEITGAEGNATNLGEIAAEAGRIGIAGVIVRNSGNLNASSVVSEGGRVFLKASQDAYVDGAGRIVTTGTKGGSVDVLGNRVAVMDNASIDASGTVGDGGKVRIGGGYQGKDTEVSNSQVTYVGKDTEIKVNAGSVGAGGTAVVWADQVSRAYGKFEARGGTTSGQGGLVETSGKRNLDVEGIRVDTRAADGSAGVWLLDPTDVTILTAPGGVAGGSISGAGVFDTFTGATATISSTLISTQLLTSDVTITTASAEAGAGDITFENSALINNTGSNDRTLSLHADRNIVMGTLSSITSSTNKLNVNFIADHDGNNDGAITLAADASIASNGGNVLLAGGSDGLGYAVGNATQLSGVVLSGASINSGNGNITIRGRGANSADNEAYGVLMDNGGAGLATTGIGTISITGYGGTGAGLLNAGVRLGASGSAAIGTTYGSTTIIGFGGTGGDGIKLSSAGIGSFTGLITLNGVSGTGSETSGVDINATTLISGGGIIVGGTSLGDAGSSNVGNVGVRVRGGSNVAADGTSTVSVSGTGGSGVYGNNIGISIGSSTVSSLNGNVALSGTAGSDGDYTQGIQANSAHIHSAGTGNVSLVGTGGAGGVGGSENTGVQIQNSSLVETSQGNVNITGTGGSGSDGQHYGINVDGASIAAHNNGTVSLTGAGGSGTEGGNSGIRVGGSFITNVFGATNLNGTGGTGGAGNNGVELTNGYNVLVVGNTGAIISGNGPSGTVTVKGMGGANGNGVQLRSGSQLQTFAGSLTVVGAAKGLAKDDISLDATSQLITGSGTLSLNAVGTSGGALTSAGEIESHGGNVNLTANADISITGVLNTDGTDGTAGYPIHLSAGNINITANNPSAISIDNIEMNGFSTSYGGAGGTLTIGTASKPSAATKISLGAVYASGGDSTAGSGGQGGAVFIRAPRADVTIASVTLGGGDTTGLAGNTGGAGGDLAILAAQSVNVLGNISADGGEASFSNYSYQALNGGRGGAVTIKASGSVSIAGDINITGKSGTNASSLGTDGGDGGDVAITAGTFVTVGNIASFGGNGRASYMSIPHIDGRGGDVSIIAGTFATIGDINTTGGRLTGYSYTPPQDALGGDVRVYALDGNVTTGTIITATAGRRLTAQMGYDMGNRANGGTVTLFAHGSVTNGTTFSDDVATTILDSTQGLVNGGLLDGSFTGLTLPNGDIIVNSSNSISLSGSYGANVATGHHVILDARNGSVALNGDISAVGGVVAVSASGNISVGASSSNVGNRVVIKAGDGISMASGGELNSDGGNMNLTANSNIAINGSLATTGVSLSQAGAGDLTVTLNGAGSINLGYVYMPGYSGSSIGGAGGRLTIGTETVASKATSITLGLVDANGGTAGVGFTPGHGGSVKIYAPLADISLGNTNLNGGVSNGYVGVGGAGGDLAITAAKSVTLNDSIYARGGYGQTGGAGGSVTISSTLGIAGAARNLNVRGGSGGDDGTTFGGAGGKVSLIAGADINMGNIVAAGGYGSFDNYDGSGNGFGGDVRIYALGGDVTTALIDTKRDTDFTAAGGNIAVFAHGAAFVSSVDSGSTPWIARDQSNADLSDITITSGNLASYTLPNGDIIVSTKSDIVLAADVKAESGKNVILDARYGSNISLNTNILAGSGVVSLNTSGGAPNPNAGTIEFGDGAHKVALDAVRMQGYTVANGNGGAGGALNVGSQTGSNEATSVALGNVYANGGNSGGSGSGGNGGSIFIRASAAEVSFGSLNLDGGNAANGSGGAGGTLTVRAAQSVVGAGGVSAQGGDTSFGHGGIGGTVNIHTAQGVTIAGTVDVTGAASVGGYFGAAGGDVSIIADSSAHVGNISSTGGYGVFGGGAGGDVRIYALGGNVTAGNIDSTRAGSAYVAGGTITLFAHGVSTAESAYAGVASATNLDVINRIDASSFDGSNLSGFLLPNGDIIVNSSTSISVPANALTVGADNHVILDARGGSVTLGGYITANGGVFSARAAEDVSIGAASNIAARDIAVSAGQRIIMAAGGALAAQGGNASLVANSGIEINGSVSTTGTNITPGAGDLTIVSNGPAPVVLGALSLNGVSPAPTGDGGSGGTLTITSSGSVSIAGPINANGGNGSSGLNGGIGGAVKMNAGDDISIAGDINALGGDGYHGGDGGSVSLTAAIYATVNGNIATSGGNGVGAGGANSGGDGGAVAVMGGADVNLYQVTTTGGGSTNGNFGDGGKVKLYALSSGLTVDAITSTSGGGSATDGDIALFAHTTVAPLTANYGGGVFSLFDVTRGLNTTLFNGSNLAPYTLSNGDVIVNGVSYVDTSITLGAGASLILESRGYDNVYIDNNASITLFGGTFVANAGAQNNGGGSITTHGGNIVLRANTNYQGGGSLGKGPMSTSGDATNRNAGHITVFGSGYMYFDPISMQGFSAATGDAGNGGNLTIGTTTEPMPGESLGLSIVNASGGDALAGKGGNGGSVRINAPTIGVGGGPYILAGGTGLSAGGAGGSVSITAHTTGQLDIDARGGAATFVGGKGGAVSVFTTDDLSIGNLDVAGGAGSTTNGSSVGGAGGSVSLIGGTNVSARNIHGHGGFGAFYGAGADVRVYSLGGNVTIGDNGNPSNQVVLDTRRFDSNSAAGGDIALFAHGEVQINGEAKVGTGNFSLADATNGLVDGSNINAGNLSSFALANGDVIVNSSTDISLATPVIAPGKNVILDARDGHNIVVNGAISNSGGMVSMSTGGSATNPDAGSIAITSNASVIRIDQVSMNGYQGSLGVYGGNAGALTIGAGGAATTSITLGRVTALGGKGYSNPQASFESTSGGHGGAITINAPAANVAVGSINLSGGEGAGGGNGGSINVLASQSLAFNGQITIDGGEGSQGAGGNGGTIALVATNAITFKGDVSLQGADGDDGFAGGIGGSLTINAPTANVVFSPYSSIIVSGGSGGDGGEGNINGANGGAGGSISITSASLTATDVSFYANGGSAGEGDNGGFGGDGGSGGTISVTTGTLSAAGADWYARGGSGGDGGEGSDGNNGYGFAGNPGGNGLNGGRGGDGGEGGSISISITSTTAPQIYNMGASASGGDGGRAGAGGDGGEGGGGANGVAGTPGTSGSTGGTGGNGGNGGAGGKGGDGGDISIIANGSLDLSSGSFYADGGESGSGGGGGSGGRGGDGGYGGSGLYGSQRGDGGNGGLGGNGGNGGTSGIGSSGGTIEITAPNITIDDDYVYVVAYAGLAGNGGNAGVRGNAGAGGSAGYGGYGGYVGTYGSHGAHGVSGSILGGGSEGSVTFTATGNITNTAGLYTYGTNLSLNVGGAIESTGSLSLAGYEGHPNGGILTIGSIGNPSAATSITLDSVVANGANDSQGNGANGGGIVIYAPNADIGIGSVNAKGGNGNHSGGHGGSIIVNANNLFTYGALETIGGNGQNGNAGDGGNITLNATDNVNITASLTANGGNSFNGNGGHGGNIVISGGLQLQTQSSAAIRASGGRGSYAYGGNGGSITLTSTNGTVSWLGDLEANGGLGYSKGGNGGTIAISAGQYAFGYAATRAIGGETSGSEATGGSGGTISISGAVGVWTSGEIEAMGGGYAGGYYAATAYGGIGGSISIVSSSGYVYVGPVNASGGFGDSVGGAGGSVSIAAATTIGSAEEISARGGESDIFNNGYQFGDGGSITLTLPNGGSVSGVELNAYTEFETSGPNYTDPIGNGGAGIVNINATAGDLSVEEIVAFGPITLTASGHIFGDGGSNPDVSAPNLDISLHAGTGIGSASNDFYISNLTPPIEASLEFTNKVGDVYIKTINDTLAVTSGVNAGGSVYLTAVNSAIEIESRLTSTGAMVLTADDFYVWSGATISGGTDGVSALEFNGVQNDSLMSVYPGPGGQVRLSSGTNLHINTNIDVYTDLALRADSTGTGVGQIVFGLHGGAPSDVRLLSGNIDLYDNPTTFGTPTSYANIDTGGTATSWMLVNNVANLQAMGEAGNLADNFALGRSIDASATSLASYGDGNGFAPVGAGGTPFIGRFDGLGNAISGLTINRPSTDNVGLFGSVGNGATVSNLGLINANIIGRNATGSLAGENLGLINYTYATGSLSSVDGVYIGGLVGINNAGAISNSYSSVNVSAQNSNSVGGLVGANNGGAIANSYATGDVIANLYVGGLVGDNRSAIDTSFSTGHVIGNGTAGGLVGNAGPGGTVNNSYWDVGTSGQVDQFDGRGTGKTTAALMDAQTYGFAFNLTDNQGGVTNNGSLFVGDGAWRMIDGQTRPLLASEYSTTIRTAHQLQLVAMNVDADYTLANDIDMSELSRASGMWATSTGFAPINYPDFGIGHGLTGTFDGQGYDISNLVINRPTQDKVGLFASTTATAIVKNLTLTGGSVVGQYYVGALAGKSLGTVDGVTSDLVVTGQSNVGGLLGDSWNTVSNSASSGAVVANYQLGGLIGYNHGNVAGSHASGNVTSTGNNGVGGLIGISTAGNIDTSYATGTVSAANSVYVGGLVGAMSGGNLNNSYATGNVTGLQDVGGLIGNTYQTGISDSYALGNVTAGDGAGGLVGQSRGSITRSYASGNVSGGFLVGGLTGITYNSIADSYATGAVTGTDHVGGLAGLTYSTIDSSYATGLATGNTTAVGALVGWHTSSINNSYALDQASVPFIGGAGGPATVVNSGLITAGNLHSANSYDGFDISGTGGDSTVWRIYEGNTGPLLRSLLTPLTITAEGTRVYDAQTTHTDEATVTYSASSPISGQLILGTLTTTIDNKNVGTHTNSTVSGAWSTQQGYDIIYAQGSINVTPAPVTATANSDTTKVYNGASQSVSGFTTSGTFNGETLTGLTAGVSGTNAASYVATFSGSNTNTNYNVTSLTDGSLVIDQKTLTASLAPGQSKVYDGTPNAVLGVALSGLVGNDAVTASASGLYDTRNVGTQSLTVYGANISLSGTGSSNYKVASGITAITTGEITQLDSVVWTGAAGILPNWSSSANWSGGALPDGSNVANVIIPAGANVTFDSGVANTFLTSINSSGQLNMAGGTLTVNGTLITDGYIQTGGILSVGGDMSVLSSFSKASGSTGSLALTGGNNVINITQAVSNGNLVFFDDKPLRLGTVTAYGGSINIDTIGLLQVLGTITAPATSITNGSDVTQTSDIRLAAHSPLTVDAPITASGKITLIGGATIGAGDNVTINAAITSTAGGNISVQAGDNVVQNANISTNGGSIAATADTGNLTMATSAQSNSGGGAIAYNAPAGNLTTGGINAGTGSIAIDAGNNVVTNGVIASSGSGGTTITAGGGLAINAPINASGNGNINVSAVNDVAQNASISSQGGTIAATATTGNVVMAPAASTSSNGGTITYFAPDGNMTLAKLDAGPTGNIELDAMGSIGPALGLVGPMLTGAAASIEAGGDVVVTQAVTRIDIDTPGRITATDTITNTTFFVLSDVEQAAAATSSDTSTQSLITATEDALATVGDTTLGIGGQTVAQAATDAIATTGGTSGSFGEDNKSEEEKKKEAEAKAAGADSGATGSAAKAVKTCT